jgi:hypothetical protein
LKRLLETTKSDSGQAISAPRFETKIFRELIKRSGYCTAKSDYERRQLKGRQNVDTRIRRDGGEVNISGRKIIKRQGTVDSHYSFISHPVSEKWAQDLIKEVQILRICLLISKPLQVN